MILDPVREWETGGLAQETKDHMTTFFGRREPLLPLDAKKIPKIRRRAKMPGPAVIFTYAWVFMSVCIAVAGYIYCSTSATRVSLACDKEACTFERHFGSSKTPAERVSFPRQHLLSAQATRTRHGEAIEFHGGRRRRQRPLGHSFVIRYKLKSAEPRAVKDVEGEEREGVENFTEHTILFTKHNVGRKRSRRQAAAINSYIRRDVETLEIQEEKSWTVFGVLIVVLGLVSGIFGALLGEFSDSKANKREKKST